MSEPIVFRSPPPTVWITIGSGAVLVLLFAALTLASAAYDQADAMQLNLLCTAGAFLFATMCWARVYFARTILERDRVVQKDVLRTRFILRADISGYQVAPDAITLLHWQDTARNLKITPEVLMHPEFRAWLETQTNLSQR